MISRFEKHGLIGLILLVAATALGAADPPLTIDEADPMIDTWTPLELPADLAREKITGEVIVEFIVNETGIVTSSRVVRSTDARLDEAALISVKQWTFSPAIRDRQVAACAMRVPIRYPINKQQAKSFLPPIEPHALPFKKVEIEYRASTAEAPIVSTRLLGGNVMLGFAVNEDGAAEDIRVLGVNCAELIRPAIDSLTKSKFTPARQGPLFVPSRLEIPFEFYILGENRTEVMQTNGLSSLEPDAWAGYKAIPFPISFAEPIFPYDALITRQEGEATIEFTVNKSGAVENPTIVSASAPEFGSALQAAIRHWHFEGARDADRNRVETRVRMNHRFDLNEGPHAQVNRRLAERMRSADDKVPSAKGLDKPLAPIFRLSAIPPAALQENADAQIEVIIDQDGQCRMPRVRKSSDESFGWAAAAAIAQWVFERPLRDGIPTDVRVVVPVQYRAK